MDSCLEILANGIDPVFFPECQQYLNDIVEKEQKRYWAEVRDTYSSRSKPSIMADNTDHSKLTPVTVKVFKSPATGNISYQFPVAGSNVEKVPRQFIIGGNLAIPGNYAEGDAVADWVGQLLTKLGIAAGSVTFSGILGVFGTFVGAANASSPQVQRENFQLIREAPPQEAGEMTVWMSRGETASASSRGVRSGGGGSAAGGPNGTEPSDPKDRSSVRISESGVPVVTSRSGMTEYPLEEYLTNLRGSRENVSRKLLVVWEDFFKVPANQVAYPREYSIFRGLVTWVQASYELDVPSWVAPKEEQNNVPSGNYMTRPTPNLSQQDMGTPVPAEPQRTSLY